MESLPLPPLLQGTKEIDLAQREQVNTYGYVATSLIRALDEIAFRVLDSGRAFPERFWLIDDAEKDRLESLLKEA